MTTVTLLSKTSCVQCTATKRYLKNLGISYSEKDVTTDSDALRQAKDLGYSSAPVVVVEDSQNGSQRHWSGFQPELIRGIQ